MNDRLELDFVAVSGPAVDGEAVAEAAAVASVDTAADGVTVADLLDV